MTTDAQPALQSTDLIMMVRPASFRMNEQTAVNNAYQHSGHGEVNAMGIAQVEFDGVVAALEGQGVRVAAYDDDPDAAPPVPSFWAPTGAAAAVGGTCGLFFSASSSSFAKIPSNRLRQAGE